LIGATAIDDKL